MPTLIAYRQHLARSLGSFAAGIATIGSSTSVLECATWPFKSTIDKDDEYRDQWLFRPAATLAVDKVRYVASYSSLLGRLTPDLPWTNTPYPEAFEIHGLIEPESELPTYINQALKRCFLVVEFTFTPVATQTRHSLAVAAPWLSRPEWVYQVGYLGASEDRNKVNPFQRVVRGVAVKDGATVSLDHLSRSFGTTDALYVLAIKPAYYHCAPAAGAYGAQSGLALEGDIAVPSIELVAAAAAIEAWQARGHLLATSSGSRIIKDQATAAAIFTDLAAQEFTPPARLFRQLVSWG